MSTSAWCELLMHVLAVLSHRTSLPGISLPHLGCFTEASHSSTCASSVGESELPRTPGNAFHGQ